MTTRRSLRRPRLPRAQIRDAHAATLELSGGRITNAIRERSSPKRLRLDKDAAQLARFEAALRLHVLEQLLIV